MNFSNKNRFFLKILHVWTGPLPKEELLPDRPIKPFLHWFIHPLKRRLAKYYLLILQKVFGLKVVALTGSTGKTTTTNLLYSVLSLVGPTVKTMDSVTSTYNIPTTILKCNPRTKFLILEMGVEYIGDMDFYCWLTKPNIGLLLNVSSVHSSYMGSVENILAEKSKLLTYSKIGITQGDFPKVISSQITSDLKTEIKLTVNRKSYLISLSLLGAQYSENVSATVAVSQALGISMTNVVQGLESVTPPLHRMNVIKLNNRSLILDDTYNANPLSVSSAIDTLSQISNAYRLIPIFVFGQMNELGQYEQSEHEKIGQTLKRLSKIYHLGSNNLLCIGPATKFTIKSAGFGKYYDTQDKLLSDLRKLYIVNCKFCLLIKGSRSWHLENLVKNICTDLVP